ncbi:MAG TPA: ATP-binding protein [Thermomicrobiaceae bacterium]|nr:ATP-binding protein [Thermomicrobiaceae bacterium]
MSIRVRIALLSAALATLVLLAISAGVYYWFQRSTRQETDVHLRQLSQTVATQGVIMQNGQLGLRVLSGSPFSYASGIYIQTTDLSGNGQDNSPDLNQFLPINQQILGATLNGHNVFFTTTFLDSPVRVISVPVAAIAGSTRPVGTLQVAESLLPVQHTIEKLRLFLFGGLGVGLLLTALGAFVISGRSLRPLEQITRTAREIGGSGDLSQRIEPPRTGDEVQDLAETFNTMLERLEDAFMAERRFVSDASHELRTPLTALRGNAEILLRQLESGDLESGDAAEVLVDIRDESERMGRLVQSLLTLARADVGWRPALETLALDQVAEDVARVAAPLAAQHHFTVNVHDEVDVLGNADQLKQLLLILLDNAFAYTPAGSEVSLTVRQVADTAEMVVADNGPGIPPDELDHIFDRFYRGDVARTRRAVGAGLGLAIARWIVDCHHAEVSVQSTEHQGTIITVRLPAVSGAEPDDQREVEPLAAVGATTI